MKFSHTLFVGKYYLVDAGYPYFKATWTPTKILGTISLILDLGQELEEEMKCLITYTLVSETLLNDHLSVVKLDGRY